MKSQLRSVLLVFFAMFLMLSSAQAWQYRDDSGNIYTFYQNGTFRGYENGVQYTGSWYWVNNVAMNIHIRGYNLSATLYNNDLIVSYPGAGQYHWRYLGSRGAKEEPTENLSWFMPRRLPGEE